MLTLASATYDAADRRLTSTNVDGLTLTYTYDGLGPEMRTDYLDGTFTERTHGPEGIRT